MPSSLPSPNNQKQSPSFLNVEISQYPPVSSHSIRCTSYLSNPNNPTHHSRSAPTKFHLSGRTKCWRIHKASQGVFSNEMTNLMSLFLIFELDFIETCFKKENDGVDLQELKKQCVKVKMALPRKLSSQYSSPQITNIIHQLTVVLREKKNSATRYFFCHNFS